MHGNCINCAKLIKNCEKFLHSDALSQFKKEFDVGFTEQCYEKYNQQVCGKMHLMTKTQNNHVRPLIDTLRNQSKFIEDDLKLIQPMSK